MSNEKKLKLLTEWMALSYTPDMIKESKERNGGKIFLKGPLQKSNTLNQNGRIYPHAILERELKNYQKFIRSRNGNFEEIFPDSTSVDVSYHSPGGERDRKR